LIILADSLYSTGPTLELLKELNYNYIIGAKEGNHKFLYETYRNMKELGKTSYYKSTEKNLIREAWACRNIPINNSSNELTNFIYYQEYNTKGEIVTFSWITDLEINRKNIFSTVELGRKRWLIENTVFNSLKNKGYNLEHNYGHGKKNLSNIIIMLLLIVFLIYNIYELISTSMKDLIEQLGSKKMLWRYIQVLCNVCILKTFEDLCKIIKTNIIIRSKPGPPKRHGCIMKYI